MLSFNERVLQEAEDPRNPLMERLRFLGIFSSNMDEFFKVMTLMQTKKLTKPIPIVLYGKKFWDDVLDMEALVRHGTISAADLDLFFETDSVDEAFDFITTELIEKSLGTPGGVL